MNICLWTMNGTSIARKNTLLYKLYKLIWINTEPKVMVLEPFSGSDRLQSENGFRLYRNVFGF